MGLHKSSKKSITLHCELLLKNILFLVQFSYNFAIMALIFDGRNKCARKEQSRLFYLFTGFYQIESSHKPFILACAKFELPCIISTMIVGIQQIIIVLPIEKNNLYVPVTITRKKNKMPFHLSLQFQNIQLFTLFFLGIHFSMPERSLFLFGGFKGGSLQQIQTFVIQFRQFNQ